MEAGVSESFYNLDFLDFAQEFLRRNAIYQAQFIKLSTGPEHQVDALDFRIMAQSWGLEFRVSTDIIAPCPSGNLARL